MLKKLFATLFTALAFLLLVLSTVGYGQAADTARTTAYGKYSGSKTTVYPDWFKESFLEFEEDIAEAASQNKRVMLIFHQDGCPYCNALVERNLSQKDIAELMMTRFDVIAINMWGDREIVAINGKSYTEKSFAAALKVQFTPTLIFFNEQGKIILRLNGYLPPPHFLMALRYVSDKAENQQSYRDYVKANQPPVSSGELNDAPVFAPPPYDLAYRGQVWERPLAVFFEQKQCPNCDILHNTVLADPETYAIIEQFKAVQLDMWSDTPLITPDNKQSTARQWAGELGIGYAPTIVLFNRKGDEIIRSEAYFRIFHSQSVFDYVLNGGYKSEPSFQRYLSARADALRERGIDVDIWR